MMELKCAIVLLMVGWALLGLAGGATLLDRGLADDAPCGGALGLLLFFALAALRGPFALYSALRR